MANDIQAGNDAGVDLQSVGQLDVDSRRSIIKGGQGVQISGDQGGTSPQTPTPQIKSQPIGRKGSYEAGKARPLSFWNNKMKTFFGMLPQSAQDWVLDSFKQQEKTYNTNLSKLKQDFDMQINMLSPIFDVANRHRARILRTGLNHPAKYFDNLASFDTALARQPYHTLLACVQSNGIDPVAFCAFIVNAFGITPESLCEVMATGSFQNTINQDAIMRQQQELAYNQQYYADPRHSLSHQMQGAPKRVDPQKEKVVRQQLEAFRDDVGPDGELKHPYFDDVAQEMGWFMEKTGESDLTTLYTQALSYKLMTDPDFKDRVLAETKQGEGAQTNDGQDTNMNLKKNGMSAGFTSNDPNFVLPNNSFASKIQNKFEAFKRERGV